MYPNNRSLKIMQNEENTASGSPITLLQFDLSSCVLISGDKSGTVSYSMAKGGSYLTCLIHLQYSKLSFLLFLGLYNDIQKGFQ
jgi:hypothetical protein